MSGSPEPGLPGPGGLLGTLRSWLLAMSGDIRPAADDPATPGAGPNAHAYGSVRVLVADDNPVNLMLISALMESRGFVPLLAVDGAEALALACELQFDLIVMDLQMPVLDGLRATAAIRRFEMAFSRPAVPVVAYSSHPPSASVLAAHGINGSLSKPCEDRDLEDCLVQWCPTYHAAPTGRGLACDNGARQAARPSFGSGTAALR